VAWSNSGFQAIRYSFACNAFTSRCDTFTMAIPSSPTYVKVPARDESPSAMSRLTVANARLHVATGDRIRPGRRLAYGAPLRERRAISAKRAGGDVTGFANLSRTPVNPPEEPRLI
jgi:hypothetical protein